MKITLTNHSVYFEPAQRLLMLEATRERGGESVRILHASGNEEEEGSFRLVARSRVPSLPDNKTNDPDTIALAMPSEFFVDLSPIAELDLWNPPEQYRTLPETAKGSFDFHPGERYSIVVLASGTLADVKVVAE